mmetsp:Transcript_155351/g.289872  ORF Transcript_155351/g.289872 Transcript_155351/m.289872 type:complete len:493 (+) Transcript_155351:62-1540(+)
MNLLALTTFASLLNLVSGHAYMYWPKSREAQRPERAPQDSKSYSPSAWAFVGHAGRGNHPFPYTVASQYGIGDGHAENNPMQKPEDFSGFLCNGIDHWKTVATYTEGGPIQIIIVQNAEHGGHHDFRLCPTPWSTLKSNEEKAKCLDMYLLGCESPKDCGTGPICKCGHQCTPTKECGCYSDRCKPTNPHRSEKDPIYSHGKPLAGSLVHGANVFNLTLPKGVTCEQCTLQWVWQTTRNGEQFANCADIKIEKDPSKEWPAPAPPPAPSPAPSRRRSATRRRSPARRRSKRRRSTRRRSTRRRSTRRRRRRRSARRRSTAGSASATPLRQRDREEQFESLGCFPMSRDDNDDLGELHDMKCAKASKSQIGLCRSGMPFYRLQVTGNLVKKCFHFCASKGLDLFGLHGSECRCGATQTNAAVWGDSWLTVREGLTLNFSQSLYSGGDLSQCGSMRVFRYIGWLSAAPGQGLTERTEEDEAYIQAVVKGWASNA